MVMKTLRSIPLHRLFIFFLLTMGYTSCSQSNSSKLAIHQSNENLSSSESEALLYMLEEEKLARDTYTYLNSLWTVNQFANIKQSEQRHMEAIQTLLDSYEITYEILPMGQFNNPSLQDLYNQLTAQGQSGLTQALQVGATIEDLDIVDLDNYLKEVTNPNIAQVFQRLQCGSRNHLRSFVFGLENAGASYTPVYLETETYETILDGNHERCGMRY